MSNGINLSESFGKNFINDHSLIFLLFSNLILIFFAFYENWSLINIMFIYWCQSIIIGVFTFIKIIRLKNFTKKGISLQVIHYTSDISTKYILGVFFLLHYGLFHLIYLFFLIFGDVLLPGEKLDLSNWTIFLVIIIFLINHAFSFFYNQKKDKDKKYNIGRVFAYPYFRIVPMHLTIVFGSMILTAGAPKYVLFFFLFLKTISDVGMHIFEHKEKLSQKIQLILNKKNFKPGDEINGKLILCLNKPKKANYLKISFVVEKIIISPSNNNQNKKNYVIYSSEKILDYDRNYSNESFIFNFQIPEDIFYKINNWKDKKNYLRAKQMMKSFGFSHLIKEYNNFYIKAELDVPLGIDIKKIKEINVQEKTTFS